MLSVKPRWHEKCRKCWINLKINIFVICQKTTWDYLALSYTWMLISNWQHRKTCNHVVWQASWFQFTDGQFPLSGPQHSDDLSLRGLFGACFGNWDCLVRGQLLIWKIMSQEYVLTYRLEENVWTSSWSCRQKDTMFYQSLVICYNWSYCWMATIYWIWSADLSTCAACWSWDARPFRTPVIILSSRVRFVLFFLCSLSCFSIDFEFCLCATNALSTYNIVLMVACVLFPSSVYLYFFQLWLFKYCQYLKNTKAQVNLTLHF